MSVLQSLQVDFPKWKIVRRKGTYVAKRKFHNGNVTARTVDCSILRARLEQIERDLDV